MRHSLALLLLAGTTLAAACADRKPEPTAPPAPSLDRSGSGNACLTPQQLASLLRSVFPSRPVIQIAVGVRIETIGFLTSKRPRPDTALARRQAFQLIDLIMKLYDRDFPPRWHLPRPPGGDPASLASLLNGILCLVGLPPAFRADVFGEDGAAAVVTPDGPPTDIVTSTMFAGVHVETGSVSQPAVITVHRLPDSPGPLLTQFDQYPLFYEYSVSGVSTFDVPVIVGACQPTSIVPPDPSRLRLAHNVAPFTPGSIEVLPLAPATFLDCTDADIGLGPGGSTTLFARGRRLLGSALRALEPQPLEAKAMFGSGVGGSTRNFSPFGAVDTLGILDTLPLLQGLGIRAMPSSTMASVIGPPPQVLSPKVRLSTPSGRPLAGFEVTFVVTAGGGTVEHGDVFTDASGFAAAGAWALGPGTNTLTVTAIAPPGTGFRNSPAVFTFVNAAP